MSFTTPAYNKATHFLGFLTGVVIGKTVEFDVSLQNKIFNKDITQNERQLIDKFQEHVDKKNLQRDRRLTSMAAQGNTLSMDTVYYGSMDRSLESKYAAIKLFRDVGMDEEAKQVASEIRPLIKQIEAQQKRHLTMAAQGNSKFQLQKANMKSMHLSMDFKYAAIKSLRHAGMDEEAKQVASEIRPLMKQIEAQHKRHFLNMAAQGNESPAIANLKSMHTSLMSKYFAIKSLRGAGMDEEAKEVASEIRPLMKEIEKIEMELKKIQPGVQLPQRK